MKSLTSFLFNNVSKIAFLRHPSQTTVKFTLVQLQPRCMYASLSGSSQKQRKRFYKDVSICESSVLPSSSEGKQQSYEILLDKRKLKTPTGRVLTVNNELLAHMIAHEWQSQEDTIKMHTMHLTSLLFTCLDNPLKLTREQLLQNIFEYLDTDTLLFFDDIADEFDQLVGAGEVNWSKERKEQEIKWRPLVNWANERFAGLNLQIYEDLGSHVKRKEEEAAASSTAASEPPVQRNPNDTFEHYLSTNFDFNTLMAFNYMCESLKSVILSVALVEQRVKSVDEACYLASLELEHQLDQWGKVEWYHSVNEAELKSRVASALLFIYLGGGRSPKQFRLHKTKFGLQNKIK